MEGEIVSVRDGMQSECKRKEICTSMGNRVQEKVIVGVTQTFDYIDQSGERPRTGTRWFGGIGYSRLSVPGLQLMVEVRLCHPSPAASHGCVRCRCLMSDEVGLTL